MIDDLASRIIKAIEDAGYDPYRIDINTIEWDETTGEMSFYYKEDDESN